MDRELLIEIGTEELPASWLPASPRSSARGSRRRLRRGAAAVGRPRSRPSARRAGWWCAPRACPSARPTSRNWSPGRRCRRPSQRRRPADRRRPRLRPQAGRRARRRSQRVETPKGVYLAYRRQLRGKAAVDVLPDGAGGRAARPAVSRSSCAGTPQLDDGKGELLSGRPIRWVLFLYGGRVVPFDDLPHRRRQPSSLVQDIRSGAVTFGHRFLTTSGRAGRAIKVKGFDDYRRRLAENFVILERGERHDRIARELDAEARRRGGRVERVAGRPAGARTKCPTWSSIRRSCRARSPTSSCGCPAEVLTTTMIHHQHFFPLVSAQGALMPAFLAVLNMEPEKPETVARNLERVLTARLRDARFFWDADRAQPLEQHRERLATVAFHKGLGSFRDKADRLEPLARWIAADVLRPARRRRRAPPRRRGCARPTSPPTWCASSPSCRARWAASTRARTAQPEAVWKAIYHHYLPTAVEADARADPGRARRGGRHLGGRVAGRQARHAWSACSSPASGRPGRAIRTASAAPRRALVRILADLPELTGLDRGDRARTAASNARSPGCRRRPTPPSAAQALCGVPRRPRAQRLRAARRRRAQRAGGDATATARGSRRSTVRRRLDGAARVHRLGRVQAARRALQAREEHRQQAVRRRVPRRRGGRQAPLGGADRAGRAGAASARLRAGAAGHRGAPSRPATATARPSPKPRRSAPPWRGSSTT